jgi:hypothetical protein
MPRGVYPLAQSRGAGRRQVGAAVAAAGRDPAALRTEQLNDPGTGPILEQVEAGQRAEWKDIADRSSTYKSYWAQWKSLAVRNGILESHWEYADGRSKTAQIILPRSRVKDVLIELHGAPSRRHLGDNETVNKVQQRYYRLQERSDIEK